MKTIMMASLLLVSSTAVSQADPRFDARTVINTSGPITEVKCLVEWDSVRSPSSAKSVMAASLQAGPYAGPSHMILCKNLNKKFHVHYFIDEEVTYFTLGPGRPTRMGPFTFEIKVQNDQNGDPIIVAFKVPKAAKEEKTSPSASKNTKSR